MSTPDLHPCCIPHPLLTVWLPSDPHPHLWYWGIQWWPLFPLASTLWQTMVWPIPTSPPPLSIVHATATNIGPCHVWHRVAWCYPPHTHPTQPTILADVNNIPALMPKFSVFHNVAQLSCAAFQGLYWRRTHCHHLCMVECPARNSTYFICFIYWFVS